MDDTQVSGMGLGLYICRGIVKQHDGTIEATSPGSGHGSTFHVALPLITVTAATPATAQHAEESAVAPRLGMEQTAARAPQSTDLSDMRIRMVGESGD